MRKTLFSVLMLAAVAFACTKPEQQGNENTPGGGTADAKIELTSGASVSVPVEGDIVTINFKATADWTAASDAEWLTLTTKSGKAGDACSVKGSAVKNETNDVRTAKVTITAGKATAEVTVTQDQTNALNIKVLDYEVDAEGGTVEVQVEANVEYEVTIPEAVDWVHNATTKGLATTTVTLTVDPSTDLEAREANIKIAAGDLSSSIKITQAAFEAYFDWIEPYNVNQWSYYWGEKLYLPQEGFDITIDVSSNIEWRTFFSVWSNDEGKMVDSYDLGWCQLSFDENSIHLVGSANETYVARSNIIYCECTINGAVSSEFGAMCEFIQDGLVPEASASVMWTKKFSDINAAVKPGYNRLAYKTANGDALLLSDGEKIHVLSPADGSYLKSITWNNIKPVSICSDEAGNIIAAEDIAFEKDTEYDIYYTSDVNADPVSLIHHKADFSGTLGGIRVRGNIENRAVVTGFISGSRYWAGWEIDNKAISMDNYYAQDTGGQARGPIANNADAWSPESGAAMSVGPTLSAGVMYRAYDTVQSLYYLADAYTPNWMDTGSYVWNMVSDAGAGGDENQNNMDIIDYEGRRIMAYTQGMQWNYVTNADVYFLDITNPSDVKVIAILDGGELACVDEIAIGTDYGWGASAAYTSADVKLHVEEGTGLVCYVVNSSMESLSKVLVTF